MKIDFGSSNQGGGPSQQGAKTPPGIAKKTIQGIASGGVVFSTSATLHDEISLRCSGAIVLGESITLTGAGDMNASGALLFGSNITLIGAGSLSESATVAFSSSLQLDGAGDLVTNSGIVFTITAQLTDGTAGAMQCSGTIQFAGSAQFSQEEQSAGMPYHLWPRFGLKLPKRPRAHQEEPILIVPDRGQLVAGFCSGRLDTKSSAAMAGMGGIKSQGAILHAAAARLDGQAVARCRVGIGFEFSADLVGINSDPWFEDEFEEVLALVT